MNDLDDDYEFDLEEMQRKDDEHALARAPWMEIPRHRPH